MWVNEGQMVWRNWHFKIPLAVLQQLYHHICMRNTSLKENSANSSGPTVASHSKSKTVKHLINVKIYLAAQDKLTLTKASSFQRQCCSLWNPLTSNTRLLEHSDDATSSQVPKYTHMKWTHTHTHLRTPPALSPLPFPNNDITSSRTEQQASKQAGQYNLLHCQRRLSYFHDESGRYADPLETEDGGESSSVLLCCWGTHAWQDFKKYY